MERTHRDKAVTSIQQGPRYVGARKKIPPLGVNCPQTENHGAILLVHRNSPPFYNSLLSPFSSLFWGVAILLHAPPFYPYHFNELKCPGAPPKIFLFSHLTNIKKFGKMIIVKKKRRFENEN